MFRLFPPSIHLFQGQVFQVLPLVFGFRFHVVETFDKLLVGMFEGIVWIDFVETGSVDQTEHHITKLLGGMFLGSGFGFFRLSIVVERFHLRLKFGDFLLHLLPHIAPFFPIKAHITSFVLNAVSLDERG